VVAVGLAWQFGARSLNAVVVPLVAAVVVGAVYTYRSDEPAVTVSSVTPGDVGESRRLTVAVAGAGLADVTVNLPPGVAEAGVSTTMSLPGTIEREIELTDRGVYAVGPTTICHRGPLGLIEQPVEVDATGSVTVYPVRHELSDEQSFGELLADEAETERQSFDRVREYEPGDPLRRIHWKTSAKHEQFHVVEFDPTQRIETVTIVAEAVPGAADSMAEAVASIADAGLDAGLTFEVAVPGAYLPPGQGTAHRENLLGILARTESGTPAELTVADGDIAVLATGDATTVRTNNRETAFAELRETGTEVPA
jgi:Uncharacterized conserved protein (some members contain a von Willebrand factor type A (vWA) domain)